MFVFGIVYITFFTFGADYFTNSMFFVSLSLLILLPLSATIGLLYSTKKLREIILSISSTLGSQTQSTKFLRKLTIIAIIFVVALDLNLIYLGFTFHYGMTTWSDSALLYGPALLTAFTVLYYFHPFRKDKEKRGNAETNKEMTPVSVALKKEPSPISLLESTPSLEGLSPPLSPISLKEEEFGMPMQFSLSTDDLIP